MAGSSSPAPRVSPSPSLYRASPNFARDDDAPRSPPSSPVRAGRLGRETIRPSFHAACFVSASPPLSLPSYPPTHGRRRRRRRRRVAGQSSPPCRLLPPLRPPSLPTATVTGPAPALCAPRVDASVAVAVEGRPRWPASKRERHPFPPPSTFSSAKEIEMCCGVLLRTLLWCPPPVTLRACSFAPVIRKRHVTRV